MTKKENAFRRIFDVASEDGKSADPQPLLEVQRAEPAKERIVAELTPDPGLLPPPKTRGRPKGKKSDPEYEAAIAYIRKKTHLQVKRRLLDLAEEEVKLDFSELVQELLEVWVLFEQGAEPDSLIARLSNIRKSGNSD
ncbi:MULTISPECIES: hypothetical protein [Kamptonema]|uniref:hypothetical protein n=1 Tax=Kamptonema TaxID=1501433 RepID=UPI0001DAD47B|nr:MULTISPECIES: hypothetical protein [Kamptonema]CBN55261.1 hypothetical protein OSCI_1610006 [Kamptonema sp. PCC 6506]